MNKKTLVDLYTDGACSGNPGAGGYGAILRCKDKNGEYQEKILTAGYKLTTNNRMELLSVIVGLEALKKPCSVTIYSDSKYVVDAIDKNWLNGWIANNWKNSQKKAVKNVDLWKRFLDAKKEHDIKFVWIKGHNGHEFNERCDKLAVMSSKSDNLLDDNF